jgi:hypothetical protein
LLLLLGFDVEVGVDLCELLGVATLGRARWELGASAAGEAVGGDQSLLAMLVQLVRAFVMCVEHRRFLLGQHQTSIPIIFHFVEFIMIGGIFVYLGG